MCTQWTCGIYYLVITGHSIQPISQFSSPSNEFKTVWPMFPCNTIPSYQKNPSRIIYKMTPFSTKVN